MRLSDQRKHILAEGLAHLDDEVSQPGTNSVPVCRPRYWRTTPLLDEKITRNRRTIKVFHLIPRNRISHSALRKRTFRRAARSVLTCNYPFFRWNEVGFRR